jgi:hypothetical protein
LGYVSSLDSQGRTIWIADAHRGDGKRFIVRADEKLTAFVELESAIRTCRDCLDRLARFFPDSTPLNGSESGGGHFPARFFISSGPAIRRINVAGKGKEEPINPLIQLKTTILPLLIPLALALAWPALAPMAQAVGPDTDGAISGSNNGEGIGVLVSRTSGVWNTGTGFEALNHLTAGNQNTATGLRALYSDANGGFNTATGRLFALWQHQRVF